jgi:hypothetical protein
MSNAIESATTLIELRDALINAEKESIIDTDTTALPVFGGPEPANTMGIFSWDKTSLLVQSHDTAGWEIISRDETI